MILDNIIFIILGFSPSLPSFMVTPDQKKKLSRKNKPELKALLKTESEKVGSSDLFQKRSTIASCSGSQESLNHSSTVTNISTSKIAVVRTVKSQQANGRSRMPGTKMKEVKVSKKFFLSIGSLRAVPHSTMRGFEMRHKNNGAPLLLSKIIRLGRIGI